MNLTQMKNSKFEPVVAHVRGTFESVNASGGAVFIIENDRIVTEEYWGTHEKEKKSRKIQEDSLFHVASVRKSYIGYAVGYALNSGAISSLDDEVGLYLKDVDHDLVKGTTIRHLLTHSHGLTMQKGELKREFPAGESWAYRGIGVDWLAKIVHQTTGQTVADILAKQVFQPLGFKESGWFAELNTKHVDVIRDPNNRHWQTSDSTAGDKMNMYVSARELAYWGYLHLKKGSVDNEQVVPREIIELATSVQSPTSKDQDLPQNGFLWFVKDRPSKSTEIGEQVLAGAFQILGYTGVALLVIPQHDIVAVRMFNSFGSPDGFDYLEDVRSFGDTIMRCLGE